MNPNQSDSSTTPTPEDTTEKSTKSSLDRRQFLGLLGASVLAPGLGCERKKNPTSPAKLPGRVVGASADRGHALRFGSKFPRLRESLRTDTVIVGGGIAGLTAAWRLRLAGETDFLVLDLEDVAGGTARSDSNSVGRYPWGAHYLPAPPPEARALRRMLKDFDVIVGEQENGSPRYNPKYICPALEERVFEAGLWTEGLWPKQGQTKDDVLQFTRFQKQVNEYIGRRDSSGKKAFTLPLAECSQAEEFIKLDRISAEAWLTQNGYTSKRLRWFIEYGLRDDYGGLLTNVSAWAMLHYHVARKSKEHHYILTFPEGNGWFVRRLQGFCPTQFRAGQLVSNIKPATEAKKGSGHRWSLNVVDFKAKQQYSIHAKNVIYAAPKYTLPYVLFDYPVELREHLKSFHYAPWAVANLTLSQIPGGFGAPPAWDNILYDSPSLGYVVSTHKQIDKFQKPTVATYYWPLPGDDTVKSRNKLRNENREIWCDKIITDMSQAHPKVIETVRRLDICFWGHAMIRPEPGFISGAARHKALLKEPGLFFAGADGSGLPFFEEAHYSGVLAAESLLKEQFDEVDSIL